MTSSIRARLGQLTAGLAARLAEVRPARSAANTGQVETVGREPVTRLGRLRDVRIRDRGAGYTLEAELFDGLDAITLVWFGRRRIVGIEVDRVVRVRGRIAERDGTQVLYNPYYELQRT
ncbi:ATP-dependent DNA helicase RecG [Tamaricihabitans halophyticus]|uniref:ATP-dependent DNA helicase RecG n=1 Tax=Tamaricihabitans halophyticus TaxID=1262583 RepID=A0A4R2R0J1_9PSEU|nr:OB-fold nucleic acid binding domain-containing protein [Tamaricihabitans halophyticus]TCP55224.1 ATP-dependent DNA helicase RecG [Tamaricihabitans halophyticus]